MRGFFVLGTREYFLLSEKRVQSYGVANVQVSLPCTLPQWEKALLFQLLAF